MKTEEDFPGQISLESRQIAGIGERVDFCMQQYHPFLRHDFNLNQLAVITNIPLLQLEIYFRDPSLRPFDQYLDGWRVKYAKNLMHSGKVRDMELKTIGSLSGFSSVKKFIDSFVHLEGISPEAYQSQINTTT
jgi:AraC-like DNA-binding protein